MSPQTAPNGSSRWRVSVAAQGRRPARLRGWASGASIRCRRYGAQELGASVLGYRARVRCEGEADRGFALQRRDALVRRAKTDTPRRLEWKGSHTGIVIYPEADAVVTAMQENALHGWRLSDGQHMRMSGYPAKTELLSFSRTGKWLASSGADTMVLWPFFGGGPMGKAPTELAGGDNVLCSRVAFHPQQELCAGGFADGLVVVADVPSVADFAGHRSGPRQRDGAGLESRTARIWRSGRKRGSRRWLIWDRGEVLGIALGSGHRRGLICEREPDDVPGLCSGAPHLRGQLSLDLAFGSDPLPVPRQKFARTARSKDHWLLVVPAVKETAYCFTSPRIREGGSGRFLDGNSIFANWLIFRLRSCLSAFQCPQCARRISPTPNQNPRPEHERAPEHDLHRGGDRWRVHETPAYPANDGKLHDHHRDRDGDRGPEIGNQERQGYGRCRRASSSGRRSRHG